MNKEFYYNVYYSELTSVSIESRKCLQNFIIICIYYLYISRMTNFFLL